MINTEKLKQVIEAYKADFAEHFEKERYKWEAVKCFQDNWDSNADDFAGMLKNSFEKTYNLLGSMNYYPRRMLVGFAKDDSEATKNAFRMLFDESKDIRQRIQSFIDFADDRKQNHNPNKWKSHYQDCRAISAYLCLMYPTKYYFYKQSQYDVAKELIGFEQPKGFKSIDKLLKHFEICDVICEYIKNDIELINMLRGTLNSNEYKDESLHLLVQDILYFITPQKDKPKTMSHNNSVTEEEHSFKKTRTSELTIQEKESIIALYYARLHSNDSRYQPITKNLKDAAICLGLDPNPRIIGNIKDNYDPFFDNGRNGYTDEKNTRTKLQIVIQSFFENYSTEELLRIVNAIEKNMDFIFGTTYTKSDFLNEVYMTEQQYDTLTALLKHKKNIILQGAPGVGKTFTAKRLAYSLMGEKDNSRIEFIQFHQSYSYEDFIMGYRPNKEGKFELKDGVFYRFCEKARDDTNNDYFFIIDEINRGNLSKIFGELLMLIEKDYRSETVTLAYKNEKFSVPNNLYIIGMMNTADRSLAMIDYALRRRFSFFTMSPAFEKAEENGFKLYTEKIKSELYHKAIDQVIKLNKTIRDDISLGKGYEIGHSYFIPDISPEKSNDIIDDSWVKRIIIYEIAPLIKEYWFDDEKEADEKIKALYNVIGERYDD